MTLETNITRASHVERLMERVAGGYHAAPLPNATGYKVLPSRHRLMNALGGITMWLVGRELMNTLTGHTPQGEEVDKDSLPIYLQPLHGLMAYNRYDDHPNAQWMCVLDDLVPAVLGAIGAVGGSMQFFQDSDAKTKRGMAASDPTICQQERGASLKQAKTWRVLSGIAGIFSISSGLALLPLPFNIFNYGVSLNNAFWTAAGRKVGGKTPGMGWISNSQSTLVDGPYQALHTMWTNLSQGARSAFERGEPINDEQIKSFVDGTLKVWFKEVTPDQCESMKTALKNALQNCMEYGKQFHLSPQEVADKVQTDLKQLTHGKNFVDLVKDLGLNVKAYDHLANPQGITFGNNGWVGWVGDAPYKIANYLGSKLNIGKVSQEIRAGLDGLSPNAGRAI